MISRLPGAVLRGLMVAFLIATPSMVLPIVNADAWQAMALLAICAGVLTVFEYGSRAPCLLEFRGAAPFNRIRFGMLFVTILSLSLILRGMSDPNSLAALLEIVGQVIWRTIDFACSPVRLLVLMMPDDAGGGQRDLVHSAIGLASLITLLSLAVFGLSLGRRSLPGEGFNLWVNLPTFDSSGGRTVVARLWRDGCVSVLAALVLPFVIPVAMAASSRHFAQISLDDPLTMIWVVAAWAFLPASLLMRGIAMIRIAAMIGARRPQSPPARADMVAA